MFGWIEIYSSLHYEKAEERRLLLEGKGFRCKMKIKTGARFSPAARAKESGGTGLGLSIAKWIVDRHGGHFKVLTMEEVGTRITVVL